MDILLLFTAMLKENECVGESCYQDPPTPFPPLIHWQGKHTLTVHLPVNRVWIASGKLVLPPQENADSLLSGVLNEVSVGE